MNVDFTLAGAVIITGLVVVFLALVGLYFLVWLFGKLFVSTGKKTEKPTAPSAPVAVKPAVSAPQIKPAVQIEDGISDEVIAVISAAVAAMGESAGGFALRGVRRVREARPAWAQAGLQQNTQPF